MALPKPLLKVKKNVTKKPSTRKELGYERDHKTGRLKKPGTTKFNEKIEFTKEDKQRFVDFYKKKQKSLTDVGDNKINAQKLTNKRIYYNSKLEIMNAERNLKLKQAEKARTTSLRNRQMVTWTKKLNSLLMASGENITVKSINEQLIEKTYRNTLRKTKILQEGTPSKVSSLYAKTRSIVTNAFYSEIHRSIIPTEIKNMTPIQAKKFLVDISKRLEKQLI